MTSFGVAASQATSASGFYGAPSSSSVRGSRGEEDGPGAPPSGTSTPTPDDALRRTANHILSAVKTATKQLNTDLAGLTNSANLLLSSMQEVFVSLVQLTDDLRFSLGADGFDGGDPAMAAAKAEAAAQRLRHEAQRKIMSLYQPWMQLLFVNLFWNMTTVFDQLGRGVEEAGAAADVVDPTPSRQVLTTNANNNGKATSTTGYRRLSDLAHSWTAQNTVMLALYHAGGEVPSVLPTPGDRHLTSATSGGCSTTVAIPQTFPPPANTQFAVVNPMPSSASGPGDWASVRRLLEQGAWVRLDPSRCNRRSTVARAGEKRSRVSASSLSSTAAGFSSGAEDDGGDESEETGSTLSQLRRLQSPQFGGGVDRALASVYVINANLLDKTLAIARQVYAGHVSIGPNSSLRTRTGARVLSFGQPLPGLPVAHTSRLTPTTPQHQQYQHTTQGGGIVVPPSASKETRRVSSQQHAAGGAPLGASSSGAVVVGPTQPRSPTPGTSLPPAPPPGAEDEGLLDFEALVAQLASEAGKEEAENNANSVDTGLGAGGSVAPLPIGSPQPPPNAMSSPIAAVALSRADLHALRQENHQRVRPRRQPPPPGSGTTNSRGAESIPDAQPLPLSSQGGEASAGGQSGPEGDDDADGVPSPVPYPDGSSAAPGGSMGTFESQIVRYRHHADDAALAAAAARRPRSRTASASQGQAAGVDVAVTHHQQPAQPIGATSGPMSSGDNMPGSSSVPWSQQGSNPAPPLPPLPRDASALAERQAALAFSSFASRHNEVVFQISASVKGNKPVVKDAIRQLGCRINPDPRYDPAATHLVVAGEAIERTEKFLSFRAAGKHIVSPSFVLDSLKFGDGRLLAESTYREPNPEVLPPLTSPPFRGWKIVLIALPPIATGIRTILVAGGCSASDIFQPPFSYEEEWAANDASANAWLASVPWSTLTHVLVEVDVAPPDAPPEFAPITRCYVPWLLAAEDVLSLALLESQGRAAPTIPTDDTLSAAGRAAAETLRAGLRRGRRPANIPADQTPTSSLLEGVEGDVMFGTLELLFQVLCVPTQEQHLQRHHAIRYAALGQVSSTSPR